MRNITKQLIHYTVPSFFSKGINLFLFPFYVKILSVNEFGKLELILLFGTFLQYFFHFGWNSAFVRLYKEEDITTSDLTYTLLYFRLSISVLLLSLTAFIGANQISVWLTHGKSYGSAVWGIVLIYITKEFLLFYESRYRIEGSSKNFMWLNIGQTVCQAILVLLFLVMFDGGLTGLIWGQALGLLVVLIVIVVHNFPWKKNGYFDREILKRTLSFGLPLVPAAVAMFLVTSSDRYMISWLIGGENGINQVAYYSFAYKIVALMALASSGFSVFWGPYVYANYRHPDSGYFFSFVFRNYVQVLFILSLVILSALPYIFLYFPRYRPGMILMPILLAGYLIYQVGDYFCVGIGIQEKTSIRAVAGLWTAFVNIVLNLILIPQIGALGASVATLVSYIWYVAILMYKSQQLFFVPYSWLQSGVTIFFIAMTSLVYRHYIHLLLPYITVGVVATTIVYFRAGGFSKS